MDIKQQYANMAAQLGDIEYKLNKLQGAKQALVMQIAKLDELAAMNAKSQEQNNEAQNTQGQKHSEGSNSPS